MYMSGYDPRYGYDPGLAGLGKKLKKLVKPVAHIAAAVATGGASLAVSAAMINAERQKKAQAEAQRQADVEYARQMELLKTPPATAPVTNFAPSTGAGGNIAPPAAAPAPYASFAPAVVPPYSATASMDMSAGAGQPKWLMPALLVGGGVAIAMLMQGRRS